MKSTFTKHLSIALLAASGMMFAKDSCNTNSCKPDNYNTKNNYKPDNSCNTYKKDCDYKGSCKTENNCNTYKNSCKPDNNCNTKNNCNNYKKDCNTGSNCNTYKNSCKPDNSCNTKNNCNNYKKDCNTNNCDYKDSCKTKSCYTKDNCNYNDCDYNDCNTNDCNTNDCNINDCGTNNCNNGVNYQTHFSIRPQEFNAARWLIGTAGNTHLCGKEEFYGYAGVALEYTQSFKNQRLASYFGNANGGLVFGQGTTEANDPETIKAINWGLTGQGDSCLCAKVDNFIADLQFWVGLDEWVCGWWADLRLPIAWTKCN